MIRGLWLLLDGPSRKPLVFDLPEKCLIVHMYHQIIPQIPFPWSNSIQITVCKKPSEKTFRPNELMPGVCKTTCAQDQNLYHHRICAIAQPSARVFLNSVAPLPRLSHFLGLNPGQPADPWPPHRPHKEAVLYYF